MILYLGTMLSRHTGSVSVIENLAPKLAFHFEIKCASSKKSRILRPLDMIFTILRNRNRTKAVIIDSYSTSSFWITVIISLICRAYNVPYIPILHGGKYPERLKKTKFWSGQVFKNSFHNVAPSGFLKFHFNNAGFDAQYIPNHIEIEKYPFIQRSQIKPKILWVRAFQKTYNPCLAIEAISLLKVDYPEIGICMVGPDKDGSMQTCRELSQVKGVSGNLIITGRMTQENWIKLSLEYDIFLNTTNVDNTPVSVIEAMALGMIIISTDAGGLPFLLENMKDAILVPVNDPGEIAKAIKILLNDPELCYQLSKNAREKAESFSWSNVEKKWTDLLTKAISINK